jgi:hypothetical protein
VVRGLARLALFAAVATALAAPAAVGAQRVAADLVARTITAPGGPLAPGAAVQGRVVVANSGTKRAGRSQARLYLSKDSRKDRADLPLGPAARVKALRPRKRQAKSISGVIPAGVAPGSYRILGCVDVTRRVRERREGNNCRASRQSVQVVAGGGPPGGGPPAATDADGDGFIEDDCAPNDPAAHPGAEDQPDTGFADSNCDGIDGDGAKAVFVAVGGDDGAPCGARGDPCATPQAGIDAAAAGGKRDVYVAGGDYGVAPFVLADGVSVYGGFGENFQRDPALATGSRVAEVRGSDSVDMGAGGLQAATVVADGITQPATIADLRLVGADTTLRLPTGQGKSSHVIVVRDVAPGLLTIARNTIEAGDGAAGAPGGNGANAQTGVAATAAMNGVAGGAADEFSAACERTSHGMGGSAGTNTGAPAGLDTGGGAGGNGGEMDTTCLFTGFCDNCDATAGDAGGNAAQNGGPGLYGDGGDGGAPNSLAAGQPGQPGRVQNGAAGPAATAGGALNGTFWAASSGGDGALGANGGGGGGGGGSGGNDSGTDSYGAGGGGGGAGGARAEGAGGGGRGGGGSFAIFLIEASPSIVGNSITRGAGGAGGAGGTGGRGQSGGTGGAAGAAAGEGRPGGRGGDGGHGGHGGGGGGGAGGISFAVFATSTSSLPLLSGNSIAGGSGGSGGDGGASAPLAPAAERDGNPGQDGPDGALGQTGSAGP